MDVLSTGPLRVAARPWVSRSGGWTLTVACKATFDLLPRVSALSAHQDPPAEEDTTWDDDPRRSLSAASDLVPFKQGADVVLVGSAYAPGGAPARSIVARLCVAEIDKAVEAFCDRFAGQDGALREGPWVATVPLRYERAAGGPGTWNPAGVPPDAPPDAYGLVHLPNLQPPGIHVERRDQRIPAAGFGPLAPTWPTRRERLGPRAGGFSPARWDAAPLPDDLDPAFFNVAPRDQQIAALREDERILLEGLHPQHARLVTSLPGVRPRAHIERPGRLREALPLVCDTLWIDTDRCVCSLVWRGSVPLSHPAEAGRVVISAEIPPPAPEPIAWEPADEVTADATPPEILLPGDLMADTYTGPLEQTAPALPFRPAQTPTPPPPRATPDPSASALPFRAPTSAPPPARIEPAPPPPARFEPAPPPPARIEPAPPLPGRFEPAPPPARIEPAPPLPVRFERAPPPGRFEPAPPPPAGV
ncbi:MAG: DUF2169 domain-containing protein [Polyangiaceae bacterium]|nr:DUF2169 domain-containing protein [Polyangiaceae bacterium]